MRARFLPVLLLAACGAPDPGGVLVIGHGGLGPDAEVPMHSAASMWGALEAGVDGVHLAVQLTADSVLVAFETELLDSITPCTGRVHALRWDELRDCPVRSATGEHPIVRLDSLLPALARRFPEAGFTLDCKLYAEGLWWEYQDAYTAAIARLWRQPELLGRLRVVCQLDEFLLRVQRAVPMLRIIRYGVDTDEAIWRALTSHYQGIVVSDDRITRDQVRFARERGLEVTIFAVGDHSGHRRALHKRPHRLQSYDPRALVR